MPIFERALGLLASVITIIGFALTISKLAKDDGVYQHVTANIEPFISSWFLVLVLVLFCASSFGFAFGYIVVAAEHVFGRISIAVSVPVLGVVSGFQTGVTTHVLAQIFSISDGYAFLLFVSFVVSAIIETLFVFRHSASRFQDRPTTKFAGEEYPRYSISLAIVNLIAFWAGALAFGNDADVFPNTPAMVITSLVMLLPLLLSFVFGAELYRLTLDENQPNEADDRDS